MPTRIYRANDMREALNQIKQDMGPDAYIVHQSQVAASRWGLFKRKQWEIVASAPNAEREPFAPKPETNGSELAAEVAELRLKLSRLVRAADLARLPDTSESLTDA